MERRLFLNEAKLVARLRHPNIVTIYDAGNQEDVDYIAMERVYNGRTLRRHCSGKKDRLSILESINLVKKCAYALQHAHDSQVVHRDIKPRNILLDHDNEPKIVDFGLALTMRPDATMTHVLGAGSPTYMSPEQIMDETLTGQTDIFSLGVVLYEMLTGTRPFIGQSLSQLLLNIMNQEPVSLRRHRADAPRQLEQIVRRSLAKKLGARYATARDFAADLELVADLLGSSRRIRRRRKIFEIARVLRFFKELDDAQLREVTEFASVEHFRAHEIIARRGESSSMFFLILAGEIEIRREMTMIARLSRGACVGEMAALSGRPRSADIVAAEAASVMAFPRAVLETTSAGCQAKLKDAFIRLLVNRLESTLNQLP